MKLNYKKIKEFALIHSGTTPSTSKPELWNGNIKWITPAELDNGHNWYVYDTQRKITDIAVSDKSLKLLKPGTVLLTSRAPIGKVALVGEPMCTNQGFKNIECDTNIMNPEFLYFWLLGKNEYLNSLGRGATFKEISKTIVENIVVPVPKLEIQNKVVLALKQALSLIDKRKAQIEALNQLTQSVFLEMFGDPFSNIKMWNKGKLENLVFKITDGEHNNPLFIDSGYPMIMAKNVLSDGIDFNNISFISNDDLIRFRKKCNPELNDLLVVSRGATIGRTCVVNTDREFALMGSVILIKMNSDLMNSIFLKTLLSHPYYKNKLLSTSGSSAQQAIYLKDLKKLEIIKPDINLQNEFANIVTQIEKRKDLINKGLTELELIFNSLMQRAFKGELFNEESKVSNL
ncbi:restriction endonuclease subunit S [Aneurinibacillus danicus]|uniref:Type I restriction-modification protein subunit S n=1 Tax=Aneurinibacillus danicus TaxID=267746 RepID=A0A511VCT9_9BACL|nr:restriction endonuclease subunit S [Aneurinibacillus danicus]GEN36221.1 type I restriction-modification protein subunit S [Aneurinibacillus danicus]